MSQHQQANQCLGIERFFCCSFQTNYVLTSLNISWNGLGYEGSLALSEMLKVNRYLLELDAQNCRIDWKGAQFISEGLKRNEALELIRVNVHSIYLRDVRNFLEPVLSRVFVCLIA